MIRMRGGFTLMEMMFTVVIVGILAAVALPNYFKAKERSYWQEAESLLLAIYAGERAYFLVNDTYLPVAATDPMSEWRKINIDNPNLASIPVDYSVAAGAGTGAAATFTATATRNSGPCATRERRIDQDRDLTPSGTCWLLCDCR